MYVCKDYEELEDFTTKISSWRITARGLLSDPRWSGPGRKRTQTVHILVSGPWRSRRGAPTSLSTCKASLMISTTRATFAVDERCWEVAGASPVALGSIAAHAQHSYFWVRSTLMGAVVLHIGPMKIVAEMRVRTRRIVSINRIGLADVPIITGLI